MAVLYPGTALAHSGSAPERRGGAGRVTKTFLSSIFVGLVLIGCGKGPQDSEKGQASGLGDMLERVNEVRAKGTYCGGDYYAPAGALTWEGRLAEAAQGHADDMKAQNYFDHTGLDGSSVGDRVSNSNFRWTTVGENIAKGQSSVASVMEDWIDSSGHCKNLMNPKFRQFGASRSGAYWVQVFAAGR